METVTTDLRSVTELARRIVPNWTGVSIYSDQWIEIRCPFEISPKDYLEIARESINTDSLAARINCLSNAKRAVECLLDTVLYGVGLSALSDRGRFPSKIKALSKAGFGPPRIIEKLNRYRNLMEHEYVAPETDRVFDFFDVAELFVQYCGARFKMLNQVVHAESKQNPKGESYIGWGVKLDFSSVDERNIDLIAVDLDADNYLQASIDPDTGDHYLTALRLLFADIDMYPKKENSTLGLIFQSVFSAPSPIA